MLVGSSMNGLDFRGGHVKVIIYNHPGPDRLWDDERFPHFSQLRQFETDLKLNSSFTFTDRRQPQHLLQR